MFVGSVSATLNTTSPEARSGWYSSPNLRSTIDLIWTCLSTLFICTWAALHLNVPAGTDSDFAVTLRKVKWMFITIIAPELSMIEAFQQWVEARRSVRDFKRLGYSPWTISHGFYSAMGGFVVLDTDSQTLYPVRGTQISCLVRGGMLDFPEFSEREIHDKSKADGFVKAVACLQASWMVVQCSARTAQGLPTSILEFLTLAYVCCALFSYCFWWNKPLDVKVPTIIGTVRKSTGFLQEWASILEKDAAYPLKVPPDWLPTRIPNFSWSPVGREKRLLGSVNRIFISLLFTGIHGLAWNASFPSGMEMYLWRVSAVTITVAGVFWLLMDYFKKAGRELFGLDLCLLLCIFAYTVSHLYLIVEPFVALRSSPAGIYKTAEWTKYIPHI